MINEAIVEDRNPVNLIPVLKGTELAKEYVYILRPLVYCVLVKKYGNSILPFVISFLMESTFAVGKTPSTSLEKQEFFNRSKIMLYYLLRNPAYDKFIRLDCF